MSIERIVLYLDSKHRTSGTASDFSITLASGVNKILEAEIIGAEIPYSFYGITSNNNRLVWTNGSPVTCTVSPGNYTVTQFASALQTAMNAQQPGWTIEYSPRTYKLTFVHAQSFTIDMSNAAGTTTMHGVIGLAAQTTPGTSATMSNAVNVSGSRYLLIKSRALTQPKITRPFLNSSQSDVLYKVSIQSGPGSILVEKNVYPNLLRYGVRQTFKTIDFQLTDDQGNLVDLNGHEWSMSVNLIPA
jgi:hypothetical protein